MAPYWSTEVRRQQPALADVVGAVVGDHRRRAVVAAAVDRAADHEVHAAPAMVGAVAVAGQRAAEVRGGEGGDLVGDAELDRRRRGRRASRRASCVIRSGWVAIRSSWVSKPPIETKNTWRLAPSALRRADQAGDDLQLVGEACCRVGKGVGERRRRWRARAVSASSASIERLVTACISFSNSVGCGWPVHQRRAARPSTRSSRTAAP